MTDVDLVRVCQRPQDDAFEDAFEELFRRYRDRAYSIAFRMTGRTNDALDIVQESFSVVFRKLATFREDSLFSTWLYRIVVNCTIDHQRRERSVRATRTGSLSAIDSTAEPVDPQDGPPLRAESADLGRHVQAAVRMLSEKLRAIMILRYQEGLSYDELADVLGISLGTVKSRLARGHLALERILEGSLERLGLARHDGQGVA